MKRPQTYQNVPSDDDTGEPSEYPPDSTPRQTVPPKGPGFNRPRPPVPPSARGDTATAYTDLQKLLAGIRKMGGRRVLK